MARHRSFFTAVAAAALLVLTTGHTAVSASTSTTAARSALAPTAGCGKNPTLTSGTHTIQSGGRTRTFILRLPDNYNNNTPYRLFFGFHWLGGTANDVDSGGGSGYSWSYYGMRQLSNNQAIFVAPQGLNNGWANSGGEDVALVDAILQRIESDLCVDTSQRFAMGFSYGGAMSFALACARANVFRAVAVYAGAQLSGCSGGNDPIAYIGLHGITDNVLNISLGRSLRDRFVRNNGCNAQNPPEPAQGSRGHIVTAYSGCRPGYPVVWAAYDNGHTPAPVDGTYTENGAQTWTKNEVWKFFSQFASTSSPSPSPSFSPSPSPSFSPSPITSPSPSPSGGTGTGACRVEYVMNAWNTGFTTSIKITNTGSSTINGWSLTFTLPSGQNIISGWNATYSPSSGQVTARNMSYNGLLNPGASTDIGFQATHNGNTAKPTSFSLNGAACTVA